ncbi:MAG: stage V sporulation protein AA, partial [Lachnospiraceae bacterium]|nr:stage V sporulation protein AA [Lachnospiraceae bacterium]
YLISRIEQAEKNVQVESLGEQDMLVQIVEPEKGRIWKRAQIVFVSMIAFFGTAFTIMAFHNDIGIHKVFERVFTLVIGHDTNNFTVLEGAYSIGLCSGIVLFFNHIGKRRITKDPTPIEVEMFLYEKNVDDTLIDNADKEGRTIDAP